MFEAENYAKGANSQNFEVRSILSPKVAARLVEMSSCGKSRPPSKESPSQIVRPLDLEVLHIQSEY